MYFKVALWISLFALCFNTLIGQSSPSSLSGIYALAKAYGYVRYFYPGDEAADLDWPRFLVYSAKEVMESNEPGDRVLDRLFKPVSPAVSIQNRGSVFSQKKINQRSPDLKPVFWQHLGDGNGTVGYPYKSLRVNRPASVLPGSQNDFATLRKNLRKEEVAGKEIELKAFFKSNPTVNAYYSVFFFIELPGKEAITVASQTGERSATKWCEYKVRTIIPDSIERVTAVIQAINMAGISYVDDISISVVGENKEIPIIQEDFSNADTAAFRISWRPVGENQDFRVGNEHGNQFVMIQRTKGKQVWREPLFVNFPIMDWIVKPLTDEWEMGWPLILSADSLQTYPLPMGDDWDKLQAFLRNQEPWELSVENLYCRFMNVILLWNKIQHFYPELDVLKVDWDAELKKALEKCKNDTTIFLHRKTLTHMLSKLKDGHMTIYYTSLMPTLYFPPFAWEWVERQLVITEVADAGLSLLPGEVVVKVDGHDAAYVWELARENSLGATESRRNYKAIFESLSGSQHSGMEIVVEGVDRKQRTLKVERTLTQSSFERIQVRSNLEGFQELKPGIFYVDLSRVSWTDLKDKKDILAKAKGIMVDLRRYPQWETINFLGHFTREPVERLQYGLPQVLYPDREQMEIKYDTALLVYPREPFFSAKTIFFTGGSAISYTEDILAVADFYNMGTIIGEPPAGTTGGTNFCYLFGGLQTPWTGIRVLRQDGKTFYNAGNGLIPDIIVPRTIEHIRKGKDDCIEYCLTHFFD